MNHPQMPPVPKAARLFNLGVAAVLFSAMLAFAGWIVVSGLDQPRPELARMAGGMIVAAAALVLLAAVRKEWRSGDPMQHDRTFTFGMALFGVGATVIAAAGW